MIWNILAVIIAIVAAGFSLGILLYFFSRIQMRAWLEELDSHLNKSFVKHNKEKQNE